MIQLSCVSGACVGERINFGCTLPMSYPGNHCGKLDAPASCLPSSAAYVESTELPDVERSKSLTIFSCGG
jgi:hypothetical protein